VQLDLGRGLTPDQAAVVAVIQNPSLRAGRDRRGLAIAQAFQAGILPNPSVSYSRDFVTGGNTKGTVTAFGFAASWDTTGLITHNAKVRAAQANTESVDLDIAWDEWQTAEGAKLAVYRLVALQEQVRLAREIETTAAANVQLLNQAVAQGAKTALDLATVQSTQIDAQSTKLALEQDQDKQWSALKKLLGYAPDYPLAVRSGVRLPNRFNAPSAGVLQAGLRTRRLDLLALERGYQSEEETLRAAVLAQFPKIGLSFMKASDTTNVHTAGFGVTIDLPIFDRNQGNVAIEKATRQKLFDEYNNRIFEAKSDIATGLSDIRSLNDQISATESNLPVLEHLVVVSRQAL
jgi:outer membrane protein TolC